MNVIDDIALGQSLHIDAIYPRSRPERAGFMTFQTTSDTLLTGAIPARSEPVSLMEQRLTGTGRGKRKSNAAAIAIGISLALHGALAVYLVTTRYIVPAPEVQETEAILVSMGPLAMPQPQERPQPPRPPVETKPVIQPRPAPAPITQDVAPLPLPPVKTDDGPPAPPVRAPVAAVSSAPAAAPMAASGPSNDFIGVDVDMALTNNPAPAYPPQAKARHEQGTVVLRLQVRGDGTVGEVQVRTSSGSMRLDQAAAQAVKRWKFKPASQGGKPVESWAIVPITFGFRKAGERRRSHHAETAAQDQTQGENL